GKNVMKRISRKKLLVTGLLLLLIIGFLSPQRFVNPVEGADKKSYNAQSYWYYPWGKSGTHKGVDIFAKEGTYVNAATDGLVVYTGKIAMGGNVALIIGPKWRLHYYAHLHDIQTNIFTWTTRGEKIGTVGASGNAKGKPPHLHYSIVTLLPYPWRIDRSRQ